MDRQDNRYFVTASLMDEALIALLDKKDYAYITVKEICQKAGVNRSTFYLHYENMDDLLSESCQFILESFLKEMKMEEAKDFIKKIPGSSLEELYLINRKYLEPYLEYVKKYRNIFRVTLDHAFLFQCEEAFQSLSDYILYPILERYQVPEKNRKYLLDFYISGLIALLRDWISEDCDRPTEELIDIILGCIPRPSLEKK